MRVKTASTPSGKIFAKASNPWTFRVFSEKKVQGRRPKSTFEKVHFCQKWAFLGIFDVFFDVFFGDLKKSSFFGGCIFLTKKIKIFGELIFCPKNDACGLEIKCCPGVFGGGCVGGRLFLGYASLLPARTCYLVLVKLNILQRTYPDEYRGISATLRSQ